MTTENKEIISALNVLLASVQVHFQNIHAMHWSITGHHFFPLHKEFEGMYEQAVEMGDDIAERILTIGGQPLDTFSAYLKFSQIAEKSGSPNDEECVRQLVLQLSTLSDIFRKTISMIDQEKDPSTADLLIQQLDSIEKHHWQYSAWLKR